MARSAVWCPRCREPIPPEKTAPEPLDDPETDALADSPSEGATQRRRYRGMVAALALVVAVVAGVSGIWAVATLNADPSAHPRALRTIERPSLPPPLPSTAKPQPSVATAPADVIRCSTRVSVPVDGTSCAYALVVAEQVGEAEADDSRFTVTAKSPHTGERHTVACVRDDLTTLCTDAAAHAQVWITNAVG